MYNDGQFFNLEGREIIIKAGSQNIFELLGVPQPSKVHLLYDEETSISISSEYENLVDLGGNKLLNIASAATGGFIPSGQFAVQGLQVWKETNVIEFSLTAELHMQDSGLNQVVIPALALAKLCVPSKKGEDKKWGQSLIPPGPNLQTILSAVGIEAGEDKTDYSINGVSGNPMHISIGKFLNIEDIILTKVEPSFSNVLDEDYMPVSCSIAMDFRTMEVANTQMIESIIRKAKG